MASKRSYVWKYFNIIDQEAGGKIAKCTLCQSTLSYSGSSTSSLGKHLKLKHLGVVEESCAGPSGMRQTSVASFFKKTDNRPCYPERRRELINKISAITYHDLRPISMVRTPAFRDFLKFTEPNFRVPSFETLRNNIITLYDIERAKVSEEIQNLALLSITTDHWTSATNDAYLGITAHGMTRDWKLASLNLGTTVTAERHTAENISRDLQKINAEWEIPEVFAVVHDNAANITNAVSRLQSYSVPCFAHTIQLAINLGLKTRPVSNLLANARSLAGFFRKSNPAWVSLQEKQHERDPTRTVLKPIQDVITRWNSSYLMLRRLLLLKEPITLVAADATMRPDTQRHHAKNLRDDEWYLAQELTKILEPLAQATELWCGEKYVSISITYPVLSGLIKKLVRSADDLPALSTFKDSVRGDLNRRFGFNSPGLDKKVPVLASALDPRFKSLSFLSQDGVKEATYKEIERLAKKYENIEPVEGPPQPAADQVQPTMSVLENLLGPSYQPEEVHQEGENAVHQEILRYRELRQQAPSADPLMWWKLQQNEFPRLATLARIILAVPATSAPSERLFSAAGELLSKKRLRLEPEFADKLLFLHENKKTKGMVDAETRGDSGTDEEN